MKRIDKNIFIIIILVSILLVPSILKRDFTPENELKYINISQEMMNNHNYFVLYENGKIYADKPPFYFWMINITKIVFGKYIFSVIAMLSVIPAMIITLMAYFFSKKYTKEINPMIPPIILISMIGFFTAGACIRMDMFMNMFIVMSVYTFYSIYSSYKESGKVSNRKYLIYLFIGLAVYMKGPAGIIVPLLTIVLFLKFEKNLKFLKEISIYRGILILLSMLALWMIPLLLNGGSEYVNTLLVKQTVGRSVNAFIHKRPFYYYLEILPGFLFPWMIAGIFAGIYYVKNIKKISNVEKLMITWFVSTFLFFSIISSKLEIYILPLAFPVAVILGLFFKSEYFNRKKIKQFSLGLPLIITFLLPFIFKFIPEKVLESGVKDGLMIWLIPVSISSVIAIILLIKNSSKIYYAMYVVITFIVVALSVNMEKANPTIGVGDLCKTINSIKNSGAKVKVIAYKFEDAVYAGFYINDKIENVNSIEEIINKKIIGERLFIITKAKKEKELENIKGKECLYKNSKFILMEIR